MNYTKLVNATHRLYEHELTGNHLMIVKAIDQMDILVDCTSWQHFLKLQQYLQRHFQIEIGVDSAYRSFRRQEALKQKFATAYGLEYATLMVAPVGTSEHHLGLAFDLSIKDAQWIMDNDTLMKKEKEWHIVHSALAHFGFILRYPKGKEAITGYPYEPWHIRYVGQKLALYLTKHQLTLEEYYTQKKQGKK